MKNKKLFVLSSLLCGATILSLTGCSSSNSKWSYTKEDTSDFIEMNGYLVNELNEESLIAGADYAMFNSSLTKDDIIVFDYTAIKNDIEAEKIDSDYISFDVLSNYKQTIKDCVLEDDGTGFAVTFNTDNGDDIYYALVNKDASVFDKFTWVICDKYAATGVDKKDTSASAKVVDACKKSWKYVKTGLSIAMDIAACYDSFSSGKYVSGAKSLSSIFTTCGGYAFSDSSDSTKETLKAIDTKIDNLKNSINSNYEQITKDDICTQIGVDKANLNNAVDQMRSFYTDYASKINDELRNINDYEHKYIKDYIKSNQNVTVYYNKVEDNSYEAVFASEFDSNNGSSYTFSLNSFTNATAYLSKNNDTISDGFIDELYKDFTESNKNAHKPTFREESELNSDIFNSIVQSFYSSYYSSNDESRVNEIQRIRNLAVNANNVVSGNSGTVSILEAYLNCVEYIYNFASECKDSFVGTCANINLLLGKIGALAEIACYYNDTVEGTDLDSSYEAAINQIQVYKDKIYNLDDNYNFVTNNVTEGTFVATYYNEAANMDGAKKPYVTLHTVELQSVEDTKTVTTLNSYNSGNFINLSNYALYDVSSMSRMYYRYHNLYNSGEVTENNVYQYLADLGVIKNGAVTAFSYLSNLGTVSAKDARFMTSVTESDLTSEDKIKMKCIWKYGACDWYSEGESVTYCSEHKKGNWSGKQAFASYLNIDGSVETNVATCAGGAYHEDHWYWFSCPQSFCFRDKYSFSFILYSK